MEWAPPKTRQGCVGFVLQWFTFYLLIDTFVTAEKSKNKNIKHNQDILIKNNKAENKWTAMNNKLQRNKIKKKSFTDVTIRSVSSRSKFYRVSRMEKLRTEREDSQRRHRRPPTVTGMTRGHFEGERVVSQSTHTQEEYQINF